MVDGLSPGGSVLRAGLGIALVVASGCGSEAPLTVLAASSLTESFERLADGWVSQGHARPRLAFDASSRLARQVEAGAPADLVVSADEVWMDWLAERALVDPGSRVVLARNALVVVVPAGSNLVVDEAGDLATAGRVALAGESVPAGRYARQALAGLGAWDTVEGRVVSGDDVRAALGWVASGDADAGIVYATDARVEPRVRVVWSVPSKSHAPIVYPAAVVARSERPDEARQFLAFAAGPAGQDVLAAAGFLPAAP